MIKVFTGFPEDVNQITARLNRELNELSETYPNLKVLLSDTIWEGGQLISIWQLV